MGKWRPWVDDACAAVKRRQQAVDELERELRETRTRRMKELEGDLAAETARRKASHQTLLTELDKAQEEVLKQLKSQHELQRSAARERQAQEVKEAEAKVLLPKRVVQCLAASRAAMVPAQSQGCRCRSGPKGKPASHSCTPRFRNWLISATRRSKPSRRSFPCCGTSTRRR